MRESYRTAAGECSREIDKIKGSRFIGTVAPVATPLEAEAFIQRLRERYADSRHTCFAYRLGPEGEQFRFGDDGEPSGSAGRPILRQLEGRHLTHTVVVVTRYFGGTKLGVGGLIRAYGDAAAAALEAASIREVQITRRIVITYDYDQSGAVGAVIAALGLEPSSSSYEARVRQVFEVPPSQTDSFETALRDRTAGRIEIESPPGEE